MRRHIYTLATLVAALLCLPVFGAAMPLASGPRLSIATQSGQTVFHIGERIALVLSFTGPDDDDSFAIDLAGYDRSGRLSEDSYNVEPHTGWRDPLATYLHHGFYMGGGIRGSGSLSSKPQIIHSNLNEWVRFDEPGNYTLTVTSLRVGQSRKEENASRLPRERLRLLSVNSLALTIIPATPAWQQQTTRRILRNLPTVQSSETLPENRSPATQDAMDDLRFLATPQAIRRLAEGLREDSPLVMAAVFGFLGLSDRLHDDALRTMRSTADEPAFPIGTMFLDTMAWMHLPEDEASFSLQQVADQAAFWQYERQRIDFRNVEWQNLMASLQRKEGPALHTTEMTLLNMAPPHPSPVSLDTLAAMIRADLPKLPPDGQARVLNECWDLIRSPALIPELRRLSQAPPELPETPNFFFTPKDRTATALQHWYEFEPDEAATEAIRQIGRPYPDLSAKDVSFLAPRTFPEFEPLWAKALAEGDVFTTYESAASLLVHFGTGAVTSQIREILRNPKDDTRNRTEPALEYLLRFDQTAAQQVLERNPALLSGSLNGIGRDIGSSAFLNAEALRRLNDPDPSVVSDALGYLGRYGGKDLRETLYKAFLRWYERNKQTPAEDLSEPSPALRQQLDVGHSFVGALLCNQSWRPDAKLRAEVVQHTVGTQMQDQVSRLAAEELSVTAFPDDNTSYEIGCYSSPTLALLEEKLDQFPSGTVFTLSHVQTPTPRAQDRFEAGLIELFQKHGMTLLAPGASKR